MDHAGGDRRPDHHHRPGHGGDLVMAHPLLLPHHRVRGCAQHGQWHLPEHSLRSGRTPPRQIHGGCRPGIGKFSLGKVEKTCLIMAL